MDKTWSLSKISFDILQQAVVPYQMVNKNKILIYNDQSVSDSVFQSFQNGATSIELVFEIDPNFTWIKAIEIEEA